MKESVGDGTKTEQFEVWGCKIIVVHVDMVKCNEVEE
jgi:hypothetical protein